MSLSDVKNAHADISLNSLYNVCTFTVFSRECIHIHYLTAFNKVMKYTFVKKKKKKVYVV